MGDCVYCFVPCYNVVSHLYPTTNIVVLSQYRSSCLAAIAVAESIQACLTLQLYHKVSLNCLVSG